MSRLASKECRRVLAVHDVEEACLTHACACVRVPSFEWVYRSNGKSCAQIHFTRHSLPDLCQMSCLLSASELRVRLHVASLTHSPGMPSWTASASSSSSSSSSSGVTIGVRSPPAQHSLSGEVPPPPAAAAALGSGSGSGSGSGCGCGVLTPSWAFRRFFARPAWPPASSSACWISSFVQESSN